MIKFLKKTRATLLVATCGATLIAGCANFGFEHEKPTPEEQIAIDPADTLPSFSKSDQSPGFFRMAFGNYTVTAVYDGYIELDSKLFKGRPPAQISRLLRQSRQPGTIRTPVNAFVLDDGSKVILIDAGGSAALSSSMGKLASSLKMSGYDPKDISVVLLTHLHPDHIGALAQDGEMVFPNAQVFAPVAEASHWLGTDRSGGEMPFYQGASVALAPYQKAGQFHTFTHNSTPAPGVQALSIQGHTPGHTGFRVRSDGESLFFWGDVVHNLALQFADPQISIDFDLDMKKARLARSKALQDAARTGEWVAGAHMPFPGIGQVLPAGKNSFRWQPVDYSRALPNTSQSAQ